MEGVEQCALRLKPLHPAVRRRLPGFGVRDSHARQEARSLGPQEDVINLHGVIETEEEDVFGVEGVEQRALRLHPLHPAVRRRLPGFDV